MITWDDSMTTGVPKIDAQHKQLIKKYNEFGDILSSGMALGKDREEAGNILGFLQFYADWHFNQEEECFDQYECPFASANRQAHAKFIEMFGEFYNQWETEGIDSEVARQAYSELGAWIENHIRRLDTQLYRCVR